MVVQTKEVQIFRAEVFMSRKLIRVGNKSVQPFENLVGVFSLVVPSKHRSYNSKAG